VFGVVPGIIGTIQATEAIKLVIGAGHTLVGRVLLLDALRMRFRELKLRKDPDCPVCGSHPTIRALIDYDVFCGTSVAETGPASEFELTAADLKARIDAGADFQIIDVREPQEFEINRIPHARLIPLGDVPGRLAELDQTRDIVAYCRIGVRSAQAVGLLRGAGFRAWNLTGGIAEWIDKVDPTQPTY
jgi:adenylyltransferase/sulfurtransferase